MSDNSLDSEKIVEICQLELDLIEQFKNKVENNPLPTFLCKSKRNNPNYLSIIFANEKFYNQFAIDKDNLIGKNYDFLFEDIDFDSFPDARNDYVRLIKALKGFEPCISTVLISGHEKIIDDGKFIINFDPFNSKECLKYHYSAFSFKKFGVEENKIVQKQESKSSVSLLKNLERTLRNERILREVAALIVDDLAISEIARRISKILCEHLRVDRCLIHDYQDSRTNFVVEHCGNEVKKMLAEKDNFSLKKIAKYINFQNHFFEKHGSKNKKSSLMIIEDISSDQNCLAIEETCKEFNIASQIAVTTTFNNKINGGIYIHQSSHRSWMTDEIELVEMIANQFSIAINRSESIEKVMITNHALMEKTSQLKEALKEEQEMRRIQNEFVALVSHEFKTPLQIIDSTRELITRKINKINLEDDAISKYLERIKSGIERMNGLIHSTLNLAKIESGATKIKAEYEVFDLKNFVQDIIEKNSNLALNKNIKILFKIDQLPQQFNGDPKLLDHAFTNIISNAIKYSKNDTTVKIMAKANDKKLALRVIDQGIGIPKDEISKIGQKFFRATNTLSVAGTGIGIYLTKHFIELHGGDVLIESEVNVGTSFTVTLPRAISN